MPGDGDFVEEFTAGGHMADGPALAPSRRLIDAFLRQEVEAQPDSSVIVDAVPADLDVVLPEVFSGAFARRPRDSADDDSERRFLVDLAISVGRHGLHDRQAAVPLGRVIRNMDGRLRVAVEAGGVRAEGEVGPEGAGLSGDFGADVPGAVVLGDGGSLLGDVPARAAVPGGRAGTDGVADGWGNGPRTSRISAASCVVRSMSRRSSRTSPALVHVRVQASTANLESRNLPMPSPRETKTRCRGLCLKCHEGSPYQRRFPISADALEDGDRYAGYGRCR